MSTALFRRIRWGTPGFVLVLSVLLAACGDDAGEGAGGSEAEGESTIPVVEAVQARYGALPLTERLSGTVRAIGQVAIYPEGSGLIVDVLVDNGDRVAEGEPLVRLRPQTSQAQLGQAEANLEVARAEAQQARANVAEVEAQYRRTEALAEDSLVSQQALETQRAQLESARAAYARAQAQVRQAEAQVAGSTEMLRQTVVRSPITGRVGQRDAEVGMRVDGGTRLFTVGRLDRVRVEVPVSQNLIGRLHEGQTVSLRVESRADTVITAEVSRISPFLDDGSFSAEIEIDVPNEGGLLRPGMFVTADVFYGESEQATLLPASAIYQHPGTGGDGIYIATSLGSEIQPTLDSETQPMGSPDEEHLAPLTDLTPMRYQPVEILAEGRGLVGVEGVEPDTWVAVVGQHMLSGRGEDGPVEARVRPTTWDRIVDLQELQRHDLLRQVMDKQQRVAREASN